MRHVEQRAPASAPFRFCAAGCHSDSGDQRRYCSCRQHWAAVPAL